MSRIEFLEGHLKLFSPTAAAGQAAAGRWWDRQQGAQLA